MKPMRITAKANVLMHFNGYFSNELSQEEKAHFPQSMVRFGNKKVQSSALMAILQS
jgi:uncharacterized protein YbgA (DUF1722 family)